MKALCYSLLLAFAGALASCTSRPGDGREGGSDKAEWSILQSLEATGRGYPYRKAAIIESHGYEILFVPRDGDQTLLYIMLDPKSPPFYKQLPTGNYWLTQEEIAFIVTKANPISTVVEALKSHQKAK